MTHTLLNDIQSSQDLKNLSQEQLLLLSKELREFIIDIVATKEGHLGASLGVVELTIALHYVYNTPEDKLIWDVGHQAYGHKILTGRKENFHTNRQFGGLSGFPKMKESTYDAFGTGHSSTSISAALGMALASKISGDYEKQHIAIIGDASIASGMAFEGLNHAGVTNANILIILNDNAMGIDPSVGALKDYLTRSKRGEKVRKNNIIEALNFNYSGPVDGHDLPALVNELKRLKSIKGPKFLHVVTTKGKGLHKAELDQVKYHAPGKFDKKTGEILSKDFTPTTPKYQDVFGKTIVELAETNSSIVGITPAMPTGSSLKYMIDAFPERAFDVGIAEQHAVTLAAGMACEGMTPYCTIYSTFLQRAYDQIIHDVALQNLPVIFCIDRAGIVGADGATHHGNFDLTYLRCIPNLVVFAPLNEIELRNGLFTAQTFKDGPMAIRYPRGRGVTENWQQPFEAIEIGKGEQLSFGKKIAVLTIGTIGNTILEIQDNFDSDELAWFNMRFVKPLDYELLHKVFSEFKTVVTIENGTIKGGFGSSVLEFAAENNYKNDVHILGIPDEFIEHGSTYELLDSIGLSPQKIETYLKSLIKKGS